MKHKHIQYSQIEELFLFSVLVDEYFDLESTRDTRSGCELILIPSFSYSSVALHNLLLIHCDQE